MGQVELLYGHEPWTTATHLERALSAIGALATPGPDERPPVLWVESGVPRLPSPSQLADRISAAWLIDTHRGLGWRARLAGAFDVVFVAQANALEPLARAGVSAHWLPLAAPVDLAIDGPGWEERPYDVAFIGQARPGTLRASVLAALGEICRVAPRPAYLAPPAMMELYAQSRVVLNIPIADDLNMRTFECAAAGALLVTGPMNRLDDVLPEGSYSVVTEPTVTAWVDAVRTALRDDSAQAKAAAAQTAVLSHHTYRHRAKQLVQVLQTAPRRDISEADRKRALAAAYARWGQPANAARLSTSPLDGCVAAGTGLVWNAAMRANRLRHQLRAIGAGRVR